MTHQATVQRAVGMGSLVARAAACAGAVPEFAQGLPPLMRVDEAANLCRVHPNTVYKQIAEGRLPAHRFGGRVLIAREDLLRFLQPIGPGETEDLALRDGDE